MKQSGKAARPRSSEAAEQRFLSEYDPSAYERPSVSVDIALLSVQEGALVTYMLERSEHPHRHKAVLPGGFVKLDESLEQAAERVLHEKASLSEVYLEQLHAFGAPRRDPRMRVISVAYYALVAAERFPAPSAANRSLIARVDAGELDDPRATARLCDEAGRPVAVGFDHAEMITFAVRRLREKLSDSPVGYQLLPARFTLLELQRVHEAVLGRELNKDSFRRKMLASGELEPTGRRERDVGHRPAELYRFRRRSAV